MVEIIVFAVLGYLAGSVPFGLILARAAGYGDIRKIGSGNIGATNVLRTGNKKLALATLFLDGAKGAAAVLAAKMAAGEDAALAAGLFSVCGHLFPVWLRFKGGKGVATALGVILALSFPVGAIVCAIWAATAAAFRYSSLAALAAVLCAPPAAWALTGDHALAGVCSILALLVWMRHRANIRRLFEGAEPKIGARRA